MANPNDKRTASQRIDDLERAVVSSYQNVQAMARDIMLIKDAVRMLGDKVIAANQLIAEGLKPFDDLVSQRMADNSIKNLQDKVANLVEQGLLVPAEAAGGDSFLVGNQTDKDGKVVEIRLQFTVGSMAPEIREKIAGLKVGQSIQFREDGLNFNLQECYRIVNPEQKASEPAPADPSAPEAAPEQAAPAPAAEAPAAEQSSGNEEAPQAAPADQSSAGN